MTKQSVLFCILAAFTLASTAQAQTSNVPSKEVAAQSQAEPVMGPVQEYSTTLSLFPLPPPVSLAPKNAEAPLFTYGLDERVRTEDWNNLMDYSDRANDEHKQLRMRTRLWGGLSTPHSEVQFNFKLNNEIKKAIYINQRFNNNEVIVDALNLQFNKTFIPGVSVSVGRQDWIKNDGFLFMDGSAGDGSRSMYFNMVNIAYTHKKSKLEIVGILDPRREHLFPLIHNQNTNLNEWDEQAVGLYYTDRNHKNTDVDAFYFLKKEVHDYRAPTNSLFQPDKHINSIGGRVLQRLPNGLSVKGEASLQWNALHANPAQSLAATSYTAFGGYVTVTKQLTKVKGKPYFMGGYTVLTGSDKQADGVGFDPLFSRWPKYSELYIYSQVAEKGVAYSTNDRIVMAEAGFNPLKAVTLRAAWYQHNAFKSIGAFNPTVFGIGSNRGMNIQPRVDVVVSKNWMGHILYERWIPGNFYLHQNPAFFFRAEATYTFRGKVDGPKGN